MKRNGTILVPLDGSKNSFRALNKAILLAKRLDSRIIGLFVVNPNPTEIGSIRKMIKDANIKRSSDFLTKAMERCKKSGIVFHDVVEYGKEGRKIVEFARKNNVGMIVIGMRGNNIKNFLLGSAANHVVHESKKPVLVVK